RQTLVRVLKEQYAAGQIHPSKPVADHIELLGLENSFTITTGHQLNIFTGPLYFIFKIVTAINLAGELKSHFPDKNFIPVYWMASEDHDFEEINHTYIGDKKITWQHQAQGATGRLSVQDMAQAIREYTGRLGISLHAPSLAKMIETAYSGHKNLAEATRYLVNALFEEYGLIVLDADHPELKKQFTPIITEDILHQNSYKAINSTMEELAKIGIESQVNPREINFFYLQDGLRERLVFENNRYQVLNSDISFSAAELQEKINQHPECFSPNVVMRPIYQEVILPNIAYVGGGAEIVYWLQLKQNFDQYGVDFPILILRNSAMFISNKSETALNRLRFSLTDIFKDAENLKKQWILNHSEHTLNLADEWQELTCIFEKIKLRAHKIDPTLTASTLAVKTRLEKAIHNLEKKLIKAEKRNHADSLSKIDTLKYKLFPMNGLQERSENFGMFYVKYGPEFISSLIKSFKPLDFKFTILLEEPSSN
ncbi:MAG TPA: bacillithiol biosynthesis cysteine-adding enzyme BshC, partial [Daejeonella sp.]|nr:bacillithiol biosynthesis cysteine-adding enzyme BshC [Daejeonella sp.]